jgi:hypothetical protein
MWGAPGSGKSTYLSALHIAVARAKDQDLMLYGADDDSTDFMVDGTRWLTEEHRFPDASVEGRDLSWVVRMMTERQVRRRFGRTETERVPFELNLDLLDNPGRVFADTPQEGDASDGGVDLGFEEETGRHSIGLDDGPIDELADCNGLLLLFDPTREWREGDAYNYFQGTLLRMAQRRAHATGRLPHYVAVCVTKFDHPDVYRHAKHNGFRYYSSDDPYFFPRVPDELAEQFLAHLVRESDRGNADLITSTLPKYFRPERIRYFITSAIGFYLAPRSNRFKEQDPMNITQEPGGARIRGAIHPVNVVEPVLWIGRNLAATE